MRPLPKTCIATALVAAMLCGCYAGDASPYVDGGLGGAGDGSIPTGDGTPCEVSAMLTTYCLRCHHGGPISASDLALTGYDALSARRDGSTVGEVALQRLRDTKHPMPPRGEPSPSAGEVQTFAAWVTGGYARTRCDVPIDASVAPDPYDTPNTCTSGTRWAAGDEGSSRMRPGSACIACHASSREEDAPAFQFAGTVYPSAHEPDDCNGSGGTRVVIVDKNGTELALTPNSVGNFSARRSNLVMPYTVRLERDGNVREMAAAQTDGDCNSCHTESGKNRAPGRVMAP